MVIIVLADWLTWYPGWEFTVCSDGTLPERKHIAV